MLFPGGLTEYKNAITPEGKDPGSPPQFDGTIVQAGKGEYFKGDIKDVLCEKFIYCKYNVSINKRK